MRRIDSAKRLAIYIVSAALIAGTVFTNVSFNSQAESYIRYDNIIIRDGANGEIQGGIAKGTEVQVIESATGTDGKQWNHVKYAANGTTHEGWVRADLMTEDKSLIAPDEEPDATEPEPTPQAQQPTEPETPEVPEDNPTESVVGEELELVIPLVSVSGDGYESVGDKTFLVCEKTMKIAEDFPDTAIPKDFEKKDIVYEGAAIKGATYKYGDVALVYLKDETGKGEFFVLDESTQKVHSFVRVFAGERSLILLVPPAEELIASSYNKTLYAVDEDTAVVAYQFSQQEELMDVGTNVAEYFYVYGMTQDGLPDWYLLDDKEDTYIRATVDLTVELDALTGTEIVVQSMDEDNSLEKMIIVVMAAIILILFVMVIVFGVRSFRARRGYYEEEDDYDEEEELGFIQRRREERKYRHFMENFEEEGDEDVTDLLPKNKVDAYLQESDEVALKDVPSQKAQDTMVLPPVDTVLLKEIIAEQEQQQEVEEPVAQEMPLDDYDIEVSEDADYDLPDEISVEDEEEYDGVSKDKEEGSTDDSEDEWKDLEFLEI